MSTADPLDRFDDAAPPQVLSLEGGFPLNRLVAFAGPWLAIVAGVLTSWLANHFPGLHVQQTQIQGALVDLVSFLIGTAVVWLGQHKWLDGYAKWERTVIEADAATTVAATTVAATEPPLEVPVVTGSDLDPGGGHPQGLTYDEAEAAVPEKDAGRGMIPPLTS